MKRLGRRKANSPERGNSGTPRKSENTLIPPIVSLQRSAGNRAVQEMVLADGIDSVALPVKPADSPEEREAEAVSHGDVPSTSQARKPSLPPRAGGTNESVDVPRALGSSGSPLDPGVRRESEELLDADFSEVRVHADTQAARSASSLDAKAFTVGSDIFFGAGRHQPGTVGGRQLITHELTHVAQQTHAGPSVQRQHKDDPDLTAPTVGNLPRDAPNPAQRVKLKLIEGKWKEIPPNGRARTANGWYDYVLKDGQFVAVKRTAGGDRRATDLFGKPPGHTEAAGGERVTYAGKVHFSKSGQVTHWDDQSGHYRPAESVRKPVIEAGFPKEKYRAKPVEPPTPGEPRGQLPVAQPNTRSRDGSPPKIRPGPPRMAEFEARYGKKPAAESHPSSGTPAKTSPSGASGPTGARSSTAPSSGGTNAPATRAGVGPHIKPVAEATPGYSPGKGTLLGGGVQMLQAKMWGNLQRAEVEKFEKRLAQLQPKIDAYLASGSTVELTLIVEKPNSVDVLCAAGAFCDQSQFVYFNELFISRVTAPIPKASAPRPARSQASMGAPGGRDSFIPLPSQGGSLTEEWEIPFRKARDPYHHCEFAKETLRPPETFLPVLPERPAARHEIKTKPKPQLDQATKEAMAAAPSRVYMLTQNMKQFPASVQATNLLAGNKSFVMASTTMGGLGNTRTTVTYFSDLDKPRAEMLANIVRAIVPSVRAELSGDGSDAPGTLQIFFGRDAER